MIVLLKPYQFNGELKQGMGNEQESMREVNPLGLIE